MPIAATHPLSRSLLIAAALGLATIAPLRADGPANPLRPAARFQINDESEPTPADPPARPPGAISQIAAELAWTEPPADTFVRPAFAAQPLPEVPLSAVPAELGAPEPLPPPNSIYGNPSDAFAADPLSDPHLAGWQQHYVHHWFAEPWFSHSDPNDPFRHVGLGQPLMGTSWRNRPFYWGVFTGGVLMGDLIEDRVNANDAVFNGLRLGYDFDHFWGLEGRAAYARPHLSDDLGLPLERVAQNYFGDVSLVCYPWGDSRWRPYAAVGLGFQTFQFRDEFDLYVSESPLSVPLSIGIKNYCSPWFSLRFDLTDNIAIGNDRISLTSHVSLMAGCEFRFGGRSASYFPWHNNTSYW